MTKLIFIVCSLLATPLFSEEPKPDAIKEKNSKTFPVFLPDGSPAKNLTFKISSRSMAHMRGGEEQSTESIYKTNDKGELILPAEYENNILNFLVIDIKGYALHIQAYYPLTELRLMPDQGFDGILLDENNHPIKNRKICVSQSIGIIWGQISIPKGINQTTTNDKGEFTMRQMVLNNKEGMCMADIDFVNEQSKLSLSHLSFKNTFYDPNYKKPKERIKIIKFVNEFTGKWSNGKDTLTITPSEILLKTPESTARAHYRITNKTGSDYHLEVSYHTDKKDHFLGHEITSTRNRLNYKLITKDDKNIEIIALNTLGKKNKTEQTFTFKKEQ